jgi:hypothetical protein
MRKKERRRRYFCDSKVQGALLRQLIYYWLFGSITVVVFTLSYQVVPIFLAGETEALKQIWGRLGPMLISSAAIAPIVLMGAIRFSNRFVGPMLRFRRVLDELAKGEIPTSPIKLRENDYWADVADTINQISTRLTRENSIADHNEDSKVEDIAV